MAYYVAATDLSPAALRQHVSLLVPAYMVPQAYVHLERMPTGSNGKLDRARLPAPGENDFARMAFVAPRTAAEQVLTSIWETALRREGIGVNDNFFELGGDSILALRVIAQSGQAGFAATLRDFYRGPTIAEMAQQTGKLQTLRRADGTQPLLPAQAWLFAQALHNPQHYNQSLLLEVPAGFDAAVWQKTLVSVLAAHDVFRLRFDTRSDAPAAYYEAEIVAPDERMLVVQAANADGRDEALAELALRLHTSLDLARGVTFRSGYLDCGTAPGRLVLVAHHLVIDAVSWEGLLRDLEASFRATGAGLPAPVSGSAGLVKARAQQLHAAAADGRHLSELGYWRAQLEGLPAAAASTSPLRRDSAHRSVTCVRWVQADDASFVAADLSRHEVLLAAIYLAQRRRTGCQEVTLRMESHGRDVESIDLASAPGWFTALFPLRLDAVGDDAIAVARAIATQWRNVPHGGVGYGVLRYLAGRPELCAAEPRIAFNYFGEFGRQDAAAGLLRVCPGSSGVKVDPLNARDCDVLISAAGTREGLQLGLDYATGVMDEPAAAAMADDIVALLEDLLDAIAQVPSHRVEAAWPATPTQRGMLLHSQLETRRGVYVNQLILRLKGDVDLEAMRLAWQRTLLRHDALRTAFSDLDQDQPLCVAYADVTLPWHRIDLRGEPAGTTESRLQAVREAGRVAGFDLAASPLMRLTVVQLPAQTVELVWTYHHVLLDGWSLPLVLGDVLRSYASPHENLDAPPQIATYARWLQSRDHEASRTYWRDLLAGLDEPTRLPLRTPSVPEDATSTVTVALDEAATTMLKTVAGGSHVTVNALVQAAWAYVLHRYTGCDEVVFGATQAGRPPELPGSERMVGLFINTIPVRVRIAHERPAIELAASLFAQQARSVDHAYVPLAQIQAESPFGPGTSLFDSVVVFENYRVDGVSAPETSAWQVESVSSDEGTHYPLTALAIPGQSLRLRVRGRADRFLPADVERIARHWRQVLECIAALPRQRQSDIDLLTRTELADLHERLRFDPIPLAVNHLSDAFSATVARHAGRPAVRCGDKFYTYAQIDRRANALAHRLCAVGASGQRVAICLDRTVSLAIALLGTVKAGATYVPLDPATPPERRRLIVADAQCRCVISEGAHIEALGADVSCVRMDSTDAADEADAPPVCTERAEAAYLIYTSGTTGVPKGVAVQHRSVLRLFAATRDAFGFDERDIWPLFHSYAFDVSVWEVWGAWLHGGCLVMVPATTTRDPAACVDLLVATGATVLNQTPTAFEALMRAEAQRADVTPLALRHVLFAGEALDFAALATWRDRHGLDAPALWNLYGITETTVHTTLYRVVADDIRADCRRVGRPIRDLQVRILDPLGRDLPVGVPGEIWVAGDGVAMGYHDRPELTAQRFVTRPWEGQPVRYYRSGDLGRYREDGELECLGRTDRQVKLRGFRIELGEIEAQLCALASVEKAVVLIRGQGEDRQIVAYVITSHGTTGEDALALEMRRRLAERLPDHMVPTSIGFVADFPRNHNGKLDVAALPEIGSTSSARPMRATDALEQEILSVWSDVLGRPVTDPDVDFFDLGGHSLKLGQVATRLRQRYGASLSFAQLYKNANVARQAALVRALPARAVQSSISVLSEAQRRAGVVLTPDQLRLWYLCQDPEQNRAYGTHFSLQLRGALDVDAFLGALRATIDRHESLRSLYEVIDGQPRQVLVDRQASQVVYQDLREPGTALHQPFDLRREPPFRARLCVQAHEVHVLQIDIHHIASDAWSIGLLIREICTQYRAGLGDRSAVLSPLPVQVADVAAWLDEPAQRAARLRDLAYWRAQLQGHRGVLALRADGDVGLAAGEAAGVVALRWSSALAAGIAQTARERAVTPFVLVLAAYAMVLQRFSGDTDIVIGAAVAQRPHPDIEPLIGFFAQTVPLRVRLDAAEPRNALLDRLREDLLSAIEHAQAPLADIVESLDIERPLGRTPLFQAVLTLQNTESQPAQLPGITVVKQDSVRPAVKFDLTVSLRETPDGYVGEIEFDRRRLATRTVERFADALRDGVTQLCGAGDSPMVDVVASSPAPHPTADADANPEDLDFLTLDELQKLLDGQEEASA
ncbi:non-ribosomal peptide synthetase [Tahibacter amnicola]|uniref:Amino acid adenylation domain-containing protein n=1 Tax=Tahibacter amnicola TaxID=2976241 RepID=A0ABY6BAV8_9GAMM|nr:non-ribosomal peptide synthetase [Tahibacter amnicola]UXI66283.1 amino acid adenylation domain-containing protein [Tahibacter amnicola]